ncbi:hypothetical protein Tco_0006059 [Tanacetum coccineum]
MATPRAGNQIARRVINDLVNFSVKTAIPKYMKFFMAQQIFKGRCFVNRMRKETQIARNLTTQLNALIAKMEALEDQGEVYDTLMSLRDDRHGESIKLMGLNDLITQAEEEIKSKEANVEMMDVASNSG